jgi:hypothetical protein
MQAAVFSHLFSCFVVSSFFCLFAQPAPPPQAMFFQPLSSLAPAHDAVAAQMTPLSMQYQWNFPWFMFPTRLQNYLVVH